MEVTTRESVKQAWAKYWQVYTAYHQLPNATALTEIDAVAVGVTRTQMINELQVFALGHKTSYGYVINHPYWTQTVTGRTKVTIGDCMDQSHFGSQSTSTGRKLTVGTARDNTRATLEQGADGAWRVDLIEYLVDTKC